MIVNNNKKINYLNINKPKPEIKIKDKKNVLR